MRANAQRYIIVQLVSIYEQTASSSINKAKAGANYDYPKAQCPQSGTNKDTSQERRSIVLCTQRSAAKWTKNLPAGAKTEREKHDNREVFLLMCVVAASVHAAMLKLSDGMMRRYPSLQRISSKQIVMSCQTKEVAGKVQSSEC